MKKLSTFCLMLLFALVVNAQCYCGSHTECYEGQTLILKGLEWFGSPEFCHNLFLAFDESTGKLKKGIKLKNTKQYLGSKVTISRIIPNVEYNEKRGSVFVLENDSWGKLYYFYRPSRTGWDNEEYFQFEGDIYCKAYFDDQIRKKEDKFEGVTIYYTPQIETRYYEGVTGFKLIKDSTTVFSLKLDVVTKGYSKTGLGAFIILGDGTQIRDELSKVSLDIDKYDHYIYSATIFITYDELLRICENKIDAFKVGNIEAREIPSERKTYIQRYLSSLL